MATPSTDRVELVVALRTTAARLAAGAAYQWGHLGQCNCGHLVQTVCGLPQRDIHAWALERQCDDWDGLAAEYCPTSGHRIDEAMAALFALGLSRDDIGHLERLDDPTILAALPGGPRWLRRNDRDDAVAYLRAWADVLEARAPAPPARAA